MSTYDNDLLDDSIDSLADLPEFRAYPAGAHRAILRFENKEINGNPCRIINLKAIETLELSNPNDDTPLTPGAETSVMYQANNEFAQGKFKPLITIIANHFGTKSIKAAMEAAEGMEATVVTKVRWNKEKTQSYTDIASIIVE